MPADDFDLQYPKWVRWFVVCVAGFTIGVGFVDGWGAWLLAHQARTAAFAEVNGRIVKSEVGETLGTTAEYSADVQFAYDVAGTGYTSSTVRHGYFRSSKRHAERVEKKYPQWRAVKVYYNPNDPADAVLEAGIDGDDLATAIFATPFN